MMEMNPNKKNARTRPKFRIWRYQFWYRPRRRHI